MGVKRIAPLFVAAVLLCAPSAGAAPIFFGATPYYSAADIPAGFYADGSPTALETFEDGVLNFGMTASQGWIIGASVQTDSVDMDDGVLDGSGVNGHSWWVQNLGSVTFTFDSESPLPTAAGLAWTDGAGLVTFEAFGPGMVSLGTIGPLSIADAVYTGGTAEDRFFGVQNDTGIQAIKIANYLGGKPVGIEVDHLQYGDAPSPVPEPSTLALMAIGGVISAFRRRQRR